MNSIIQYPDSLSLLGNMKHLVIHRPTSDEVTVEVWLGTVGASGALMTHTYTPNQDGQVDIDLKDVVGAHLSFDLQDSSEPYVQQHLAKKFSIRVTFSENDYTDYAFTVIRSGISSLAETPENFLRQNFLTWQPSVKPVTYYTPEFLTYYAQDACAVKCQAYNADGTVIGTTILASLEPGCYTIPTGYAVIAGKFQTQPGYYDVWVESGAERLTYIQRYYASDIRSEQEEWILFENSLGGIDTFRAYGDSELSANHEHKVAEIEEVNEEYRVDTERNYKKSTGYLDNRERRWLLDFFPSTGKYIYADQLIRRIVVTEDDVNYSLRDLPSEYHFTYRFAEAKPFLNLPRTDLPLDEMQIEMPDVGSFTIAPRLVEFPRQQLSGGALFPIQNPYSEQWGTTSLALLVAYISQALGLEEISDTFLSRLYDDTAEGHITFQQGLTALAPILLGAYVEGLRGGILTPEGHAELEKLWVRAMAIIGDGAIHHDSEGNIAPALRVNGDSIYTGNLSSPEFVSSFFGGHGWTIQKQEIVNAAGVLETKYHLEIDSVTIRNTLRLFEMIVAQLMGENANRYFSDMMEVDHYDPETGKVWLKTKNGKLYNSLRIGDIVEVQQYNGDPTLENDWYVTKAYEFRVTAAGVGDTALGEDRQDWIEFDNFVTTMENLTPENAFKEGEVFVRADNDRNPNRKGLVTVMAVGENTPYMDILYGLKTDPQNAMKGRIGNLQGVRTDDFGWLKGFGIYTNNLYGTGEIHDSQTGERYTARISTTKHQLTSLYKETLFDISEEDNILANGFFENGLEHWTAQNLDGTTPGSQGMQDVFGSESTPILINGQLISAQNVQQAVVIEYDSLPMLKLNAMAVVQDFADMGVLTNHKELTSAEGSQTTDVADTLFAGIRILPLTSGELTVSFVKAGGTTGFTRTLQASMEWMLIQAQDSTLSPWDISGTGVCRISYTGECLIRFITLTTDPISSAKVDYMTRVTQTARIIKGEADAVYATRTMHAELSLQASQIATEVTNNKTASDNALASLTSRLGTVETWENNTATWITQTSGTINLWGAQFDANGNIKKFSGIETDISNIRTTVTNNKTASDNALASLTSRLGTVETWENNTATWITQTSGTINQWATNFNDNGTIKDLSQLRIDVNGLLGTVGSLATTAAMESYVRSLQNSISAAENSAVATAVSQINSSISMITGQFGSDGSVLSSSKIKIAIDDIKSEIENSLGTVGIYLTGNDLGIRMRASYFSLWDSTNTDKLLGIGTDGNLWVKGSIKSGSTIVDTGGNSYAASSAINQYRIKSITVSSANTYLQLTDGAMQAITATTYNNDKNVWLPTLGNIRSALGIPVDDNRDFCCQLTIINEAHMSGNSYNTDNLDIMGDSHNYTTVISSTTARPRIMRGTNDNWLQLESKFTAIFFITYINQRFIANYIKG